MTAMVRIKCNVSLLKSEVNQICRLYYDIIRSVIPLQIEYLRIFKAAWRTILPLLGQEDSYDTLMKEGITYLKIMGHLFRRNQKVPNLYFLLIKILDLYTKLLLKFRRLLHIRQQLLNGYNVEYYLEKRLAILINFNNIDENHKFLNFKSEKEYEVEEHEIVDTFDLLIELHFLISLFKNVIVHIKMLKKFFPNPFLYSVLWEYDKKLKQFSRRNKSALKLCKLDRGNNLSRFMYNTLERMKRCISLMLNFYVESTTNLKYFTRLDNVVYDKLMIIKQDRLTRRTIFEMLTRKLNLVTRVKKSCK